MPCDYCETEAREKVLHELEWPCADGTAIFRDVPVRECPRCGEIWVSGSIAEELDRICREKPEPIDRVVREVPVYAL